jgi:hypothetical protein
LTLRQLLDAVAGELEDIEAAVAPDGDVTWSRGGRPFAAVDRAGGFAEFALDPAVAAAAARTSDVGPSIRGAGWVRFGPAAFDDHARDRARAWFESAHRRLRR